MKVVKRQLQTIIKQYNIMKSKTLKFLLLSLITSMTACENSISENNSQPTNESETRILSFSVMVPEVKSLDNLNFTQTRVTAADKEDFITFAVYKKTGEEVKKIVQNKTDTDFGSINCELPFGSYTIIVITNQGDYPYELNSATEMTIGKCPKVLDTFFIKKDITISEKTEDTIALNLKRATGQIAFISSETIPENMKSLELTVTGGSTKLNPTTGFAIGSETQKVVFDIDSKKISKINMGIMTFLPAETALVNFTVTAKDESGNIIKTMTFKNAKMERNKSYCYKGSFFSKGSSFVIDTSETLSQPIDLVYGSVE